MTCTLHDGLRARELDVGTKYFGQVEIGTADQQEAELRLTQLLVELGVAARRDVEGKCVLRLLDHPLIESIVAGIRDQLTAHSLPEVLLILRAPELFTIAMIDRT